jgi:hypothetical protein
MCEEQIAFGMGVMPTQRLMRQVCHITLDYVSSKNQSFFAIEVFCFEVTTGYDVGAESGH